jgi:hypothetical protein
MSRCPKLAKIVPSIPYDRHDSFQSQFLNLETLELQAAAIKMWIDVGAGCDFIEYGNSKGLRTFFCYEF